MDECFNCNSSASDRYTLTLEGSTVLEEVLICGECSGDFQTIEWIELEAPSSSPNRTR
ncbi:hypothetical protein [Halolamina salina]|uniref:Transcription factor zinc-finger domain-containing protein n=1 Tax=Halolamina salina TaxID=1220023 RepID=A0ABD6B956_9EURY